MRRVGRRRAQRPLDHGSNLIVVDGARAAGAGLVEQAIAAILQKSAAPLANGVFASVYGFLLTTASVEIAPAGMTEWVRRTIHND